MVALEIARARLEKMGHEVVTRDSAVGTTAMIIREKPDVLLLDVEMPLLSGDEIMHAIREKRLVNRGDELSFILYSGTEVSELRRLVKETGALGAIHKAQDSAAFAATFERLVRHL
jgi:CheY-like chemotaxis protein